MADVSKPAVGTDAYFLTATHSNNVLSILFHVIVFGSVEINIK